MPNIAKADREAMNALFAQAIKIATPVDSIVTDQALADHAEQAKVQAEVLKGDAKELKDIKTAAKNDGQTEEAFQDHKDYLETLESVLADDKKESWDPNDLLLD